MKKMKFKFGTLKFVIIAAIVVTVIAAVLIGFKVASRNSEADIISTSTLTKIIEVSDLSTFESVYNGVAVVMNEEKTDNVDYYVSYKSKIKAGINFEEIDMDIDDEEKIIKIILPEVKITDINVDIASLNYIFMNKKADTQTVSSEAYKRCIEDVTDESNSTEAIYDLAKQNAHNIVEALIKPFVEQSYSEYTLEIN